jgi:integrase
MGKKQDYVLSFLSSKKRWQVFYYVDGARKGTLVPEHLSNQEDIRAWCATFVRERQAATGQLASMTPAKVPPSPSVGKLAEKWLALRDADPTLKPATVKDNRSHMRKHILPKFGEIPLAALDTPDLREWVRTLKGAVSPNTCRNIMTTMRSFYDGVIGERWVALPSNPMRDSYVLREMPKAANRSKEVLFLPHEWAQKLVDGRLQNGSFIEPRRRVRYMVAFCTGLRDGEISGLTWDDVVTTSEVPYLRIDKAVALYGAKGRLGRQRPKTDESVRKVPIHTELIKALDWWGRVGWEVHMGRTHEGSNYVFPSNRKPTYMADRDHMSRPNSPELLREDLEALKLPTHEGGQPFTFQSTRRSFATWLHDAGVDESDIKRLLGHVQTSVVQKHYTASVLRRLAAAVAHVPLLWPDIELSPST